MIKIKQNKSIETTHDVLDSISKTFVNEFCKQTTTTPGSLEHFGQLIQQRINEYKISNGLSCDAPLFLHDCPDCEYLGEYQNIEADKSEVFVSFFDLYVHKRENREEFIARYGSKPSEYYSFTYYIDISHNNQIEYINNMPPCLKEAIRRQHPELGK